MGCSRTQRPRNEERWPSMGAGWRWAQAAEAQEAGGHVAPHVSCCALCTPVAACLIHSRERGGVMAWQAPGAVTWAYGNPGYTQRLRPLPCRPPQPVCPASLLPLEQYPVPAVRHPHVAMWMQTPCGWAPARLHPPPPSWSTPLYYPVLQARFPSRRVPQTFPSKQTECMHGEIDLPQAQPMPNASATVPPCCHATSVYLPLCPPARAPRPHRSRLTPVPDVCFTPRSLPPCHAVHSQQAV